MVLDFCKGCHRFLVWHHGLWLSQVLDCAMVHMIWAQQQIEHTSIGQGEYDVTMLAMLLIQHAVLQCGGDHLMVIEECWGK